MKLLIALLFILPLAVQAGHHKGKKAGHKKSWHRLGKDTKHYLTVGTALNFFSEKKDDEKVTIYTVKIGKGFIFKQKYDVSFLLTYGKNGDAQAYGVGVATKYLLHKMLSKHKKVKKVMGEMVPYVGMGLDWDKAEDAGSSQVNVSVGNRFPVSKNMMMDLKYTYYVGKGSNGEGEDNKTKGSIVNMSWNYFF